MGLEELYREVILDHYRNPRNKGHLISPDATAEGVNPLCGDEITIELNMSDGVVSDVAVAGQGCSISQSSASMMSEAITGRSLEEALDLIEHFRQMMHGAEPGDEDRLGDAIALEGVAKYPVRVKCALLGWMAAKDAIQTYNATPNGGG